MKKSAFSNAGGDGYFGVGGYVKKQDVASMTTKLTKAGKESNIKKSDSSSSDIDKILMATPLTQNDIKGKSREEIATIFKEAMTASVPVGIKKLMQTFIKAAGEQ